MKAVISQISPDSRLIDLTHEIAPGDVFSGAIILWQSLPYLPGGSVVLSVIDPGVGTDRRPILVQSGGITFIGPDNGSFTFILKEDSKAWEIKNSGFSLPTISTTFHGRDIFAPAAAYAATGIHAPNFGSPISDLILLPQPELSCPHSRRFDGEIIHIDRYGNALTSIGQFDVKESGVYTFHPWIGNCHQSTVDLEHSQIILTDLSTLSCASNFTEIPGHDCAFYLGSSGLLEIAANRQSAAKLLNLARGDSISLIFKPAEQDRSIS
jgi:S-adenosylmethionine hydrolase